MNIENISKETKTQLETKYSLEIKINPVMKPSDILARIRQGKAISFLVDENSNIWLTTGIHRLLVQTAGIDNQHSLWPDGNFRVEPNGNFSLESTHGYDISRKNRELYLATKDKIFEFLESHGIKFNRW